ncbi:phosphonate metabolism protein/1,5-bisphosphokinase (PRPP-forming) PhnN [Methylobrevis pamukkalensis]|nr:phosphonate metabolism protein/1,5-bisphosphokinase (PRPP-forming) PhnN [Methylobrevis pamukkalensis]
MIVVVGPSGAGKDTLIDAAAIRFRDCADIGFVRRVITRAPDAGGEAHDCMTEPEFSRCATAGRFAVWWSAHGLSYGIPAATRAEIGRGRTLVANGSRSALGQFRRAYPRVAVVLVTATPEELARRLAGRGRETEADIRARLTRSIPAESLGSDVHVVDNSGALEPACVRFAEILREISGIRGIPG